MRSIRNMAAAAAALTLGSSLLVGCSEFFPTSTPAATSKCDWMSQPAASEATGHTVVLIDRSNSTRSANGKAGVDYFGALSDVVDSVMSSHDAITIGTFDGTASTVDWLVRNQRTDRDRSDVKLRQQDDRTARQCISGVLTRATAQPARSQGTDILGAIGAGVDELNPVTGARRLVLATDGLATVGCADLRHVGIGIGSEIAAVRNLCQKDGELTTVPAQDSVEFVGVGHPAAGQPQPTTTQLGWLRQLWSTLCVQMHGPEASAGSCNVSTTSPQDTSADGRPTTAGVNDGSVTFPPPNGGVHTTDGKVVFPLGDILFEFQKSTLNSRGSAVVGTIADQIRQLVGATAAVDGYTDARGSNQYNDSLSKARADSVRAVLSLRGIIVTSSNGHGESDPLCTPEYLPNGNPDEQAMQCDRRVEVAVTTPRQ